MHILRLLMLGLATMTWNAGYTEDRCPHRGDLDMPFCDANKDLVADSPTDPKKFKNPDTLVFTYSPVEDPAHYERVFKPFTEYLAQCTGKRVVYSQAKSHGAEIDAMATGRLHVGCFSTGPTAFAVNIAGAVPFAMRGNADGPHGYHLLLIVRSDSAFQKITDLRGRKVAHTAPTSNSGHMVPMVLFPRAGLTPNKDYQPLFSGRHDRSVLGVAAREYDAAAVASDVFYRMIARGTVKESDFRVVYKSGKFPTEPFSYVYDLEPKFRDQLLSCFFKFRFSPEMQREFDGADRYVPVNYLKDWAIVREVAQASGEKFGRAAYEQEAAVRKK